ncbi:MAG: collagen-binding domain-containing protein, partial [Saprospiraceae bacterium]
MTHSLLLHKGAEKRWWRNCPYVLSSFFALLLSSVVQAQTITNTVNLCTNYTAPYNASHTYRVCLTTVTYDFTNNRSTWTYTYETLSGNNISHIVFGGVICANQASEFVSVGGSCGSTEFKNPDNFTDVVGMKFDCSNDNANPRTVSFTLNGIYSIGLIEVGLKPGSNGFKGMVAGASCTTVTNSADYGDLPSNYPTLLANGGPSHIIATNLRLGATIDANTDGLPSASANGDNTNGTNDEDGISTFPTFIPGQTATITVSLSNTTGSTAQLYGFIDWNNDGDFNDANEVSTPVSVLNNATSAMVTFNVPYGAVTGTNIGARFRLTSSQLSSGGAGATGAAINGEVEDYIVQVQADPSDCGDASTWMQNYSLIAFGDLNQMQEGEGNVFVGGNLNLANTFQIGINLTTANFGTNGAKKSLEVAGGVIGGSNIAMLNYSAAFASPVNYTSGNMGTVQTIGGGTRTINLNNNLGLSNVGIMQDVTLSAKANKMEADLQLASSQLCNTASTNNYTFNFATQNASLNITNTSAAVVNLTATEAATFFSTITSFNVSTPNNAAYTAPIIINVRGTSITAHGGFNIANIPTELLDNVIWNFCEATSVNIPTVVKGSILAPLANVTLGNNIDGVLVGQNVSIGSESHLPFASVNFSAFCTSIDFDRGDLPDTGTGTGTGNYQTLSSDSGPQHQIVATIRMGTNNDGEATAQQSANATGDDTNGTDDEDGISSFPTFVPGQNATVTVNLTNTTGGNANLYGFIDWNNDGDFADTGEAPAAVTVAHNATSASITFTVPNDAVQTTNIGARFRLTTTNLG